MTKQVLLLSFLFTVSLGSSYLNAQLRLTVDGGVAASSFDRTPVLPAQTRVVFNLNDEQTEQMGNLESGYFGLGLAHRPTNKLWGWSTRLQYMKRGYSYLIKSASPISSQRTNLIYSYSTFLDMMTQVTAVIFGKIRVNAGPFASLAIYEDKNPRLNLNGPDNTPDTRTDYGVNAGLSYPFGRLSIAVNYQQSLRRYNFSALNEAYTNASGISDAIVLDKTPRISAFRLGLEYAIWE